MTRLVVRILAPFLALTLCACDALIDTALDCIDSDGPEFDKKSLATPILNQEYNDKVTVSIRNEPRDNRFNYTFSHQGELPQGLEANYQTGGSRDVFFTGTPTELGTFQYSLFVSVEEPGVPDDFNSGLCYRNNSITYELTVAQP